ncbi:MAG TPA: oligosaccharide flippase family protein [Bacillota bacterium]|nr:oligosaccharide flippase family protein [Bacillota bacterium]
MLSRHTLLYMLSRGIPGLVNLAALSLYTRHLTPDEYGLYATIIAAVFLANSVLFAWIRVGSIRFYAIYQGEQEKFLSTIGVVFLVLVLCTGAVGLALWLLPWLQVSPKGMWSLALLLLWSNAWHELNLELCRARLSPGTYGVSTITKAILALGIGLILVHMGWGPKGLIIGLIAATLMGWSVTGAAFWQRVRLRYFDRQLFLRLFKYSIPFAVTSGMAYILFSLDRFLLSWLAGNAQTGVYSVAYDLAQQSLILLMTAVNLAAYPIVVSKLESAGITAARRQLAKNMEALCLIGLPAAVALAILAPNVVRVLLGSSFQQEGAQIVPRIAIAAFLLGLKSYYADVAFYLSQKTVRQVWSPAISILVSIPLNYWWIPRDGVVGAANTAIVVNGLALLLSWLIGRRVFALPIPKIPIMKIVGAAALMGVVLWPLADYQGMGALFLQVIIGLVTYCIVIYLLNFNRYGGSPT